MNQVKIDLNYRMLASAVLMTNDPSFATPLRNLDRFLNDYTQNRRESEYDAFKMNFELLTQKLLQTEIADSQLKSYIVNIEIYVL